MSFKNLVAELRTMVKEDGFFRHSMPLQEPIKDELVKVKFTKG